MKPQKVIADIVFLADSSSEVTAKNFALEKAFIKNFARGMGIAPSRSHGALITYASSPQTVFGFNDYQSIDEFESNVDKAPYLGGSRRIDSALTSARTILDGGRQRAIKVR